MSTDKRVELKQKLEELAAINYNLYLAGTVKRADTCEDWTYDQALNELVDFITQHHQDLIEDILKMADALELECGKDGDKGTKQWMAFKNFRNTIRDKYIIKSVSSMTPDKYEDCGDPFCNGHYGRCNRKPTPDKRVEEIVEEFDRMSTRKMRVLKGLCATCGLKDNHDELDINGSIFTHQFDSGVDAHCWSDIDWLRTTLTQYHQDLMSEVVEQIDGLRITSKPQLDFINPHIRTWEQGYNYALEEAQTIIKSK